MIDKSQSKLIARETRNQRIRKRKLSAPARSVVNRKHEDDRGANPAGTNK